MKSYNDIEKKRIAFVIDSLGAGGCQRVVTSIANELVADEVEVLIVTFEPAENNFFYLDGRVARKQIVPSSIFPKFFSRALQIVILRRLLHEFKQHTAMSCIHKVNVILLIASFGCKYRLLVSERNNPYFQDAGFLTSTLRFLLYRFSDVVTANSQSALNYMAKFVPKEKLIFLPNPILTISQKKFCTPENANEKFILCIGRLHKQKGHFHLLRAFRKFSKNYPDWRLKIIGSGELSGFLYSKCIELNIVSKVDWLGTVKNIQVWLESADIFVLPSIYEGQPNVLLEAMEFGRACVVSDNVAKDLNYFVSENSIVMTVSQDDDSLAKALNMLASDRSLRKTLGKNARSCIQNLDRQSILNEWFKLLLKK